MQDYIKELSKIYEQYEKEQTEVKQHSNEVKNLKNKMMDIIKEQGIDYAVVPGIEKDTVKLSVDIVERTGINKKIVAELIGVKQNELSKIEDWVKFTNEGKITGDIIEQAKFTEEVEKFSVENYDPEEEKR